MNYTNERLITSNIQNVQNTRSTNSNNNFTISYNDLIFNRKNIRVPNIDFLNRLFRSPIGYPVENGLSPDIKNRFLKTKRYSDNFLMPGYEVYLNNGDLIDVSTISRNILAGSAPIISAMNNFWMMMWDKKVKIIVSLTPWIENGNVKADLYYNPLVGEIVTYGNISVYTDTNLTDDLKYILNFDIESHKIKVLKFKMINNFTNTSKSIYHIHYTGWPDMNVPSISDMYALLIVFSYLKNKLIDSTSNTSNTNTTRNTNNDLPKIFIHCSAGIGRTGTFIVLCRAIEQINRDIKNNNLNGSINLLDIILMYRSRRKGLVQTQQQMDFIINFLSVYITEYMQTKNKGQDPSNMLINI